MGTKGPCLSLILLLFLGQHAFAGVCKEGCPSPNQVSKYKFVDGQVYTYNLDSVITVYLTGSKQQTQIKINGQAQLFAQGNCQYTLTIPKLVVTSPDGKKLPQGAEFNKPVKFILSNDEIKPEICVDSTDSEFSLNVKRGIISLLQSAEDKSYETDIFGVCPTNIFKTGSGDSLVITKTRDLNSCSHRETLSDGFIKGFFNEESGVKTTPILNGEYSLEQRINGGILQSAQSTEQYTYLPFSSPNSGARAKVVSKLTFVKPEAKAAPPVAKPKEATVLYTNPSDVTGNAFEPAKTTLQNLVKTFNPQVGKNSAAQFAELVRLFRHLKKGDLLKLFAAVQSGTVDSNKDLTRKIFLDALFRSGTADSVAATADLSTKKTFSDVEQRLAYLSFNLAESVTKDSLISATKSLGPHSPREAFLGIGSLVNKYCTSTGKCTAADLKDLLTKYANNLGGCKPTTRAQEDKHVSVLKGIRNAKVLFEPVLKGVIDCTSDKVSKRLRVAALQAFAGDVCNKKLQTLALSILKNRLEDSEIRIQAYLAFVRCPNAGNANEIKALLDDEPVYQVGSYINSHLASIRGSADPHRESLRRVYGNIKPTYKFPSDVRKYSFNRELSYSIDSLGAGASADTNVIYSQSSFVPTSLGLNITGELFGNVFNILEVDFRQENLQQVVEHYLGPKGELSFNSGQELYNTALKTYNIVRDKTQKRIDRRRRATKEDVNTFRNSVQLPNDVFADTEVDLSFKLFGTELYFLSFASEVPNSPQEFIDKIFKSVDDKIAEAKDFNKIYDGQSLFMDLDLVYPTSFGFPLKLGVQGSAATRLEAAGQIDVKTFRNNPKFTLKAIPSYSVQVAGEITVDAYGVEAGLKVIGNLHSSTGVQVDFTKEPGAKKFDLKLSFPFGNQELLSLDTNALFIVREKLHETIEVPVAPESLKSRKDFSGCFDQFTPYIGVTLCPRYDINLGEGPNSIAFPFAGPNSLKLSLELEKAYTVSGSYDDSNPKHPVVKYIFDTPGSENSRTTTLLVEWAYDSDYFAKVAVVSPKKTASVEAGLKRNSKEFALYAAGRIDQDEYLAKIGFDVSGNEVRSEYTPIIVIKDPKSGQNNLGGYTVDGKVVVEKSNGDPKYIFNNLKVTSPTGAPYTVNGFFLRKGARFEYDLKWELNTEKKKIQAKGAYEGVLDKEAVGKLLFDLSVISDFHDLANGQVKIDYERQKGAVFNNEVLVIVGKDLSDANKNRFHFKQNAKYAHEDKQLTTLDSKIKLEMPFLPILLSLNNAYQKNHASFDLQVESAPHKLKVISDNKYNTKTKGDFDIQLTGELDKHNAKLTATRVVGDKASDVNAKLISSCGFELGLKGKFSNRLTQERAHVDFDATTTLPNKKNYGLNFLLDTTPADAKSNAKLTEGSNVLASYNFKVTRGDTTKGTFDVLVKDLLKGNGELNSVKRKGTLSALIALDRVDRKLKLESDFNVQQPTYDVNTKFYYDFGKDDSKKIEFSTKSNIEPKNIDSKNTLLILTEKYSFNILAKEVGSTANGNVNANFELGLPTGRKVAGSLDRHTEFQEQKGNAKIKIELSDVLPNGNTRSVVLDRAVKNADLNSQLWDLTHKLTYTGFDKKDVNVFNTFTRVVNGDGHKSTIGIKVDGSLLTNPIIFNLVSDEASETKADYKANGKYGQALDFDLSTKYNVEQQDKPSTYDFNLVVNVPDTKLKKVKVDISTLYKEPSDENGQYEARKQASIEFADKRVGFDGNLKGNFKKGEGKIAVTLPDTEPINIKAGFARDGTEEARHAILDLEAKFGAKTYNLNADVNSGTNDLALKANLKTPLEKAKDVELLFNWKVSGGNTYSTNVKVDIDKKAYGYNGLVILSELSPTVSVELIHPDKTVKLYLGLTKLDESKYSAVVKVSNLFDYNMDLNGEVLFKSPANFYIKINMDSTNIKQLAIEINSKATGKGVEFKGTKDGKNLISGSADFTVKDEKGRTIIEGQGNVKLYEEQQQTSFTFIRNKFDAQKDSETGVSFVLDGRLGVKNIVSELKLTDKTALFKHTICETKKQCINVDLRSSLQRSELTDFNHELVISVDLRQLGYTHEFGLKADTSKKGSLVDHTVDMHLQSQDKSKYQYSLYLHKNSAGVTLTLPQRTISLESQYAFPADNVFGKYDSSLVFYFDKVNNPAGKTSLSFKGNLDRASPNVIKGNGEVRLENPSLKALVIGATANLDGDNQRANAKVDLDIFQQKNKALVAQVLYENTDRSGKGFNVTTDAKLTSKGLGLDIGCDGHAAINYDTRVLSFGAAGVIPTKDYTFGTFLYASEKTFELYGRVFNEDLVKVLANYDLQKKTAQFNSVFKQIGMKAPLNIVSKVDGFTTASVSVTKDKLLDVKGGFDLGKAATVRVVSNGKELFDGKVSLEQASFLTSNFKSNEADTKEFLNNLKTTIKTENEDSRKILTEKYENLKKTIKGQVETLQASLPDFAKLREEQKKQLEKLSAELQTDPTIKKLVDFYVKIASAVTQVLGDVSKILLSYYEKVAASISDLYKQLEQAFNEKLLPELKELYSQLEKIVFSLYEEALSLISSVFERVTKALKGFEEDFKKISSTLAELYKSISGAFKDYYVELEKNVKELYNLLVQQLQALPGIEALKEKFNEYFAQYNIQEQVAATLKEFLNAIKPNLPTPEWQAFVDKLNDYLYKKLTKQAVNDSEALKGLLESGILAVRSLSKLIGDFRKDKDYSSWLSSLPISLEGFKRVSYIWNVKFSPFNCLREGNCFSIRDILNYRPYGFEISELIPPFKMHAHIGDGQHIFTFDERHITFPGSCSYILAQDIGAGNFTLVANLASGKLKSVTLFDRTDVVEVDNEGIVKLNGAPATLPVRKNDIHAWRRFYSISILTTYGVNVLCSTDLRVCHVTVSGFYHNKLRGLLGNGNYEPYDDFLLPNGQIAADGVALGNAYGVGSCAPVAPIAHNHVSEKLCNDFFSAGSPMQLAFLLTNTKNYKEACEHATSTATDKLDAACNIAFTYASAASLEKIPVRLPNQCIKCQIGDKKVDIADNFQVQTPSKEADGVLVVDTALGKNFADLVQGLVTDLKKELKTRGITDVRIAVIGYNNKEKYSSLYSNGASLDFDGKLPANLNGPEYEKPVVTGNEKVDKFSQQVFDLLRKLREDFVSTSDAVAFRESIDFPFRATASKFIICVRSDELAYSSPIKQALSKAVEGHIKLLGYSVHSVVPVIDLTVGESGDASKIVGFNTNNVVQLADGRKRPEGSPDLRDKLKFKPDLGIDAILNNGGFVFALNNYVDGKAKKQFVSTMSAAVADQVSRTQQKFECVCIVKHGLFPSHICRATETTTLPAKKVAARG